MKSNKNALVLFSGGIDSTSCVHYYQNLKYNAYGLFVDYGQPARNQEKNAVEKLSDYLKIKKIVVNTDINPLIDSGVILGRNYLLLSIALSVVPFKQGIVAMGIHSGTDFPDCNMNFIKENQNIYDLYTNGNIIIDCPFVNMMKNSVYDYFIKTNIPHDYTYSCENGGLPPCGKCLSCIERKKLKNEFKN